MAPRSARLLAIGLALSGCQQADDLRAWTPTDHHHNAVMQAQGNQVPEAPASAAPARPGLDEVTLVAWRRNCTTCHGQLGRGDGPQSPMTKPRDLTDPAWQQSVTDEAIAAAILNGKGRMPAFPLPEATVQNLVALIRLLGGQGQSRPATSTAPAGAPAPGSGSPSASPP